jgi:hypothetical protein
MNNSSRFVAGLVVLVFVVLGIVSIRQCTDDSNSSTDEAKIQDQFSNRILELERKLQVSETKRTSLELRNDSLTARFDSVVRVHAQTLSELRQVKGKFNNLNSKQLQERMIDEFNKRPR